MTSKPRIAIYGAGLIGCYLGGRLHEHAAVKLIARQRVADVLNQNGLEFSDLYGHRQHLDASSIDVQTDASAACDADLVLVTVKSSATEDVADALARTLQPSAIVISFQNGIHNADILRKKLPSHTVLAGMVPFNVIQPKAGVFHQASAGELAIQNDNALHLFADVFRQAGLPLQPHADMRAVMWGKLLLNLNNALNALSGLPLREQMAQRAWRCALALLQEEAISMLRKANINVAKITSIPTRWLPTLLRLPDFLFHRLAQRMLAIDPSARSSTWDDLQAGRVTEVDYINGEMVLLARSLNVKAPANARVVALIHDVEKQPRTWTGVELLAELRASLKLPGVD